MNTTISIALFGLLGIFSRYGADLLAARWLAVFPYATLGINVFGSFFAGAVYALGTEKGLLTPELRSGMLVGFCGSFTTFSAFALQAALLLESGSALLGAAYLILSPALGLAAALAGIAVGRSF